MGKFRGGWIKLWGLPFHLWSEEHLKKIVEQWGTVIEIDWQTLKLFDLCKARVRILMKERSILSALIEVLDGGWVFTISIAMVGVEKVRRGREIGESTREDFVPHSWTCGGRRVERDRSTTAGNSSVEVVGKMKKGGKSQKAETIPVGTHGKRGLEVVNSEAENFNEQSILPALIEVLDGGWVFTISIAVVEVEEVRQGREMGESTREDFVPHSWTCGGRRVERDRSTTDESSFVRAVGKMNKGGESQKAETIPMGTHGKSGPEVVNS
ncbi:hypothetical protein VitviT2T_008578 [Vitis vinifera]|uniref:DUF4283 domain-containing protein n=1 Tax=Vitis vinifera TaxID=29760 RepID=A0ABY9C291_VITVI|nr:hypothetical protein VitviT2T_008578 [Vitis vinifera]